MVAIVRIFFACSHANTCALSATTSGTEKSTPVEARTTLGLKMSVTGSQTITASHPAASALRRIAKIQAGEQAMCFDEVPGAGEANAVTVGAKFQASANVPAEHLIRKQEKPAKPAPDPHSKRHEKEHHAKDDVSMLPSFSQPSLAGIPSIGDPPQPVAYRVNNSTERCP